MGSLLFSIADALLLTFLICILSNRARPASHMGAPEGSCGPFPAFVSCEAPTKSFCHLYDNDCDADYRVGAQLSLPLDDVHAGTYRQVHRGLNLPGHGFLQPAKALTHPVKVGASLFQADGGQHAVQALLA